MKVLNGSEGNQVQYRSSKEVSLRLEAPENHSMVAHLHISVETVEQGMGTWDCKKIFDTAAEIAGMFGKIPNAGFKLSYLFCGLIWRHTRQQDFR